MEHNKKRSIKNRNIKPKTAGQSTADFIIRTIIRLHFRMLILVQICLALSAAMPAISNGSQAFSGNVIAESDMTFPADGRWSSNRQSRHWTRYPHGDIVTRTGWSWSQEVLIPIVESRTAELYDPATGTWTLTGRLNDGRFYYPATLLPNGKVLVEGGDSLAGERASAELYDPATGTWTRTGSLNTARQLHSATLLQDGKVLVAGGFQTALLLTAWSCMIRRPERGRSLTVSSPRALRTRRTCCERQGAGGGGIWWQRHFG